MAALDFGPEENPLSVPVPTLPSWLIQISKVN